MFTRKKTNNRHNSNISIFVHYIHKKKEEKILSTINKHVTCGVMVLSRVKRTRCPLTRTIGSDY